MRRTHHDAVLGLRAGPRGLAERAVQGRHEGDIAKRPGALTINSTLTLTDLDTLNRPQTVSGSTQKRQRSALMNAVVAIHVTVRSCAT